MILGTGIDIVEIERIDEAVKRTPRLYERILTELEREQLPHLQQRKLEYIAGRFAAKEAISKALGVGIGKDFSWQDVSIVNDEAGKPMVIYHREGFQTTDWQSRKIHLSIAHEKQYAIAMAILEEV